MIDPCIVYRCKVVCQYELAHSNVKTPKITLNLLARCALVVCAFILLINCSSGPGPQGQLNDSEEADGLVESPPSDTTQIDSPSDSDAPNPDNSNSELFPDVPPLPYPASDEALLLQNAARFEDAWRRLVAAYFEQMNSVYSNLSAGVVSSEDSTILELDYQFYDELLSGCSVGYGADGSTIVAIECGNSAFLDFQFRHPTFESVVIQLRSGSIRNDGETSSEYRLMVYQSTDQIENELQVWRFNDQSFDLEYDAFRSIDCNDISVAEQTFEESNINECSLALLYAERSVESLLANIE